MKVRHFFSLLVVSMMLAGCSFQKYFIICNSTDQTIMIQYSLIDPTNVNSLFNSDGKIFQSDSEYFPNWEHPLPFNDLNNSEDHVWVKLGPKSTLVFGTISNDTYDQATMTTSAGKQFNLKEMTFSVNGVDYQVDASNFNDYFLEDGGTYKYVIQP